jgi:hypothetical protein
LGERRNAVVETVEHPDHIEPDELPGRTRFYRRSVGPSRWLLVVVSYERSLRESRRASGMAGDPSVCGEVIAALGSAYSR